jgi:hypothetical protein
MTETLTRRDALKLGLGTSAAISVAAEPLFASPLEELEAPIERHPALLPDSNGRAAGGFSLFGGAE